MVTAMVWLPGAALSEQGVVQAVPALPSSVAMALPGLLVTRTSCGAAAFRTGGRRGAGSASFVGSFPGSGLGRGSAGGDWTAGSGGVTAAVWSGAAAGGVRAAVAAPGPSGLGLSSAGDSGAAATGGGWDLGGSAFASLAGEAGARWLFLEISRPIPASRAATTSIPTRKGTKPARRFFGIRAVVVLSPARAARREGGRTTASLGTSTMVAALRLPPRGSGFQPWLAPPALSSAAVNSWQFR